MRKSRLLGLAATTLVAGLVLPAVPASADVAPAVGPVSTYFSVSQSRILDTRVGNGAPDAPLGADGVLKINVASRLGIEPGVVTPTAVVINVTAIGPTENSYAAVYPDGAPRPTVSSLNFNAGHGNIVTNRVTVQLGANGVIDLYNHVGQADFVVDIEGFYGVSNHSDLSGDTFRVGTPTRILDTRTDIGNRRGGVGPDTTLLADVSKVTDPSASFSDLVLQLTSTNATEPSYVVAYPAFSSVKPPTSDLNLTPGEDITNLSFVNVDQHGLAIYNHAGWTDLVLDYVGIYDRHPDGNPGTSGLFTPTAPARILDTRVGLGAAAQQVGGGGTVRLKVTGVQGAPAKVSAVVLNLTATNVSVPSHLTAYASGTAKPGTSNLNFVPGKDIASMVIVPVSPDGYIDITNNAGNVDLLADLQGYFSG